jgi:hypothetical protein
MKREEAIQMLKALNMMLRRPDGTQISDACDALDMAIEALRQTEWIPVKWHEITDEEREIEGYPKSWEVFMDCEMPCDEQEILVQTKNGYIRWDVCYEDGGFSLDSGWDWIEDIVAWKTLPEPYREDGSGDEEPGQWQTENGKPSKADGQGVR